ncbi:MAG: phytanoyl-CoA dioxygenase family protein [Bryobacterales bacterium]|nr:phytanoyl-CoA dioxygenase family protein [Bryobacterales bacterium]
MAYQLTSSQLDHYRRDGYLHLPAVIGPDLLASLDGECRRVQSDSSLKDPRNLRAVARRTLAGGTVIDRYDPICDLSPSFERLIHDDRVMGVASSVVGGPVHLFKDKLIFKNPGAYGYGAHQDYTVWRDLPIPAEGLISILIAVDPATAENGAVRFYPGLHHQHHCEDELKDLFGPASGLTPSNVLARAPGVLIDLDPGDAVIFSSLTPHDSAPNQTEHTRRAIFLTFSDAAYGDLRLPYYANFHQHLRQDRAAAGETDLFFR